VNSAVRLMLLGILAVSLVSFTGTFSYFTDTEVSFGNTFTAAVWDTQATFLDVNTSKSRLTGDGNQAKFFHTTLQNIGTQDITLDRIGVGWNETSIGNITQITIGGGEFWLGDEPSGEILDITDYTLLPGVDPIKITFWFNGPVTGPFTLRFIMADGAVKTVVVDI